MRVELVYESTCPNIAAARAQLLHAFAQAKVSPQWNEWEVTDPKAPDYIHGYGSPTILVNGQDVSADCPSVVIMVRGRSGRTRKRADPEVGYGENGERYESQKSCPNRPACRDQTTFENEKSEKDHRGEEGAGLFRHQREPKQNDAQRVGHLVE